MGQLAPSRHWIRSGYSRPQRRVQEWRKPKGEFTLTLAPSPANDFQWPTDGIPVLDECESSSMEISSGYASAIALLRSLRNVGEEEAQEQRESWELLKHDLDENKYH
jgi:hypothetical protein